MKAIFTIDVPDEFVIERARQFSDEVEADEGGTALEYFEGRVRDVAGDEIPLAFYGWPIEVAVEILPA